jgi:hypothetical protein
MYAYRVPMRRISLYLTAQQVAALKAIRKDTGITVAESIRRAVDEFLARHKEKER